MVIFNSYVKWPEGKSCLGPRFETLKMDEGPDPGNGWKFQIASLWILPRKKKLSGVLQRRRGWPEGEQQTYGMVFTKSRVGGLIHEDLLIPSSQKS